jgi:putative acetyltransferase
LQLVATAFEQRLLLAFRRLAAVRLETGDRQVAAMRLYERAGFRPCPPFGAYALMAPQSIATSVFFEKRICPDGDFRV